MQNSIINNSGTINNNSGGTIDNRGSEHIIKNSGTISNSGTFNNDVGTISNFGTISNSNIFINTGRPGFGTITNECGGTYSGNPPTGNPPVASLNITCTVNPDRVIPSTAKDNYETNISATPSKEVKPIASSKEVKPIASSKEVKPTTPSKEVKPTTPSTEVKPTAPSKEVKPTAPSKEVKKGLNTIEVKAAIGDLKINIKDNEKALKILKSLETKISEAAKVSADNAVDPAIITQEIEKLRKELTQSDPPTLKSFKTLEDTLAQYSKFAIVNKAGGKGQG
jgi:hypothetical protein